MRIKKLLAMLLAAAMALTLFAGCCSPSLLRLLLELLQDQYQNITVTAEDDLDATLRQAVSENDTFEDITAALAQALDKTVEFESLRSARAGDQTFSLVYRTGTDTQAIARQTYTDWNKILGSLPASGRYLADLAVRKSGGGYYILVNVTVQKGSGDGSGSGSSGGDDENGGTTQPPQTQLDYEPVYTNGTLTGYLVHTNEGLQKVFFEDMTGLDDTLMEKRNGTADGFLYDSGFAGLTITLDSGVYDVKETFGLSPNGEFELPFQGVLTSANPDKPATINLSGCAMFYWLGPLISSAGSKNTVEVSNVNFRVTTTIKGYIADKTSPVPGTLLSAGAVAHISDSTISGCNVTFANGCGIKAESNEKVDTVCVGGIAGLDFGGSITGCTVNGDKITVDLRNSLNNQITVSVNKIAGLETNVSGCKGTIDIEIIPQT